MVNQKPAAVARYSPWLVGWFQWYLRRFLRKHFHAVAVSPDRIPTVDPGARLVVYLNHAAWWDPLVAMHVADRFFGDRKVIAPFEAEAIKQYPLFERMGFFGVDKQSRRGAAEFLRTALAALDEPATSLWLTPEGRFCDPRDTSAPFEPGVAHLAAKMAASETDDGRPGVLVPLAIEYPFWEEKLPEALIRFGEPVLASDFVDYDKEAWQALLESRLRAAQAELTELSVAREPEGFDVLLGGATGVGGLYEWVRRAASKLTGKKYQASHGQKLTTD